MGFIIMECISFSIFFAAVMIAFFQAKLQERLPFLKLDNSRFVSMH
jgi:hypothetical protein